MALKSHLLRSRQTIFIAFATVFFFCGCGTGQTEKQVPNIVLLMGDDHGWEETGYNNHPFLKTPILDDMAANGLRFDRFYAGAPTCTPTRGTVITGRHPNRYGAFKPNWSIRPEEISIAQLLSDAGYATAHFGKWHLGPVKKTSPTNPGAMGFDEWLSHDNFFEMNPTLSRNGEDPTQFRGESSEILIAETIAFIKKAKAESKPFFIVIWFGSPHEPFSGLEKDLALYQNFPDSLSEKTYPLTSMKTGLKVNRPQDSVLTERYAEITAMDRSIGMLRDYLKANQLKDNSLLWYCGDNGTPTAGHYVTPLRDKKGSVYEGGIRVPGIIEWPAQIPIAHTTNFTAVTTDILPTLCQLTGQSLPDRTLDGTSLAQLINGEVKARQQPIFFWDYNVKNELAKKRVPYIDTLLQQGTTPLLKMRKGKFTRSFENYVHDQIDTIDYTGAKAVIDDQFKLVIHDESRSETRKELFDITNDIGEKNNLIDRYPEIAEDLEAQLKNWQTSVLESLTGQDY